MIKIIMSMFIEMAMGSSDLVPNASQPSLSKMLNYLKVTSLKDLYSDVPERLILERPPDIGAPSDQSELESLYINLLSTYNVNLVFTGGGMADHYVPPIVDELVSKQEFYTSYTPYQPEVSQGILQALFEYQSLMAELLGMDVVNSSLYDYGSALGEAGRFSIRVTGRRGLLIASNINPERKKVLRTYVEPLDAKISEVKYEKESGMVSLDELSADIDDSIGMVYLEIPNFFGIIEENIEEISDICHNKGALLVVGVDPFLMGIMKPPGELGADVVIGEGQLLGGYMNFGGPSLGIFAIKKKFRQIRQLPGRLIGLTKTLDGKYRGYTMALQTREQHIRQEEATSNITTNTSLMAVRAAIYLSLLGPNGIRKVAEKILYNTSYLKRKIDSLSCFNVPFSSSHMFKEIPVISRKSWKDVNRHLLEKGILGGFHVNSIFPEVGIEGLALFSTTEKHSKGDLDLLLSSLKEVCI